MSAGAGLRRVLERLAPPLRAAAARGTVAPSTFATPAVVAAMALEGPVAVMVATSQDAQLVADGVAAWLDDPAAVVLVSAWDIHPLERVSPDAAVMAERTHLRAALAAGAGPRVVVGAARALVQIVPPEPAELQPVRRGEAIDRDALLERLIGWGYRREPQVEHRGELAVRGGIVDLWSPDHDQPVRLDLFGDEVDRLTVFDVGSQRSAGDRELVLLAPAREWRPGAAGRERARAAAAAQPWAAPVLERIGAGELFDGMEGWLPLVAESRRTLLDELGSYAVVVVEPERVARRLDDVLEEESELAAVVAATWQSPDPVPLLHEGRAALESRDVVSLAADPALAEPWLTPPPVVQGDPGRIAAHVRAWPRARRGVVLTSNPSAVERMAGQLREEGLSVTTDPAAILDTRLSVAVSHLPAGFSALGADVVVWSESDLTGRRSAHRAARTRARAVEGFFDDFAVGGYVVHRHHGIARFAGTTTRAISGTVRDYLVLEFKDGRSYWPADQMEVLTPYTGGDAPSLSRLGGVDWQRTRARARAAAYLVAQDLVDLYRQRSTATGHAFGADTAWQHEMEDLFAFDLTTDQAAAVEAVKADMEAPRPMDRLVCADVGFGKTEIAVRAIFKAVQDGRQAAILVPTTLLASQHLATLSERFAGFPVRVALLSRFVDDAATRETLRALAEGTVDVVVGTHRLLGEDVRFRELGLLVVDEEQRFGVADKEAIKRRWVGIDVLTLSASPIPRTLEMALSGIRDLSMVTTPPADRRPILTHVGPYDEAAVVEAVRRELLREGQVFFVHNRVADIELVAQRMGRLVPDARVAIAHGQMDEGTLERVMIDFWERRTDLLVCTTIVESGIDLPSVNTLIVDRAERLGLGQLHQLRGRVGRSGQRAYAYLFHADDHALSEAAYERLRTIGDNTALGSGFKIAMRDLEIRGAGNLLGHDQSGPVAAVGYDLYVQLVAEAVAEAKGIVPAEVATVSLDVPGEAHLPVGYVEGDDARLEAYRRLAAIEDAAALADLRDEWVDRYGPLPPPALGLIELAALRLACLAAGITTLSARPRPGRRDRVAVHLGPVTIPYSVQVRLRRRYGSRSYDEVAREVRVELATREVSAARLRDLVLEVAGPREPGTPG